MSEPSARTAAKPGEALCALDDIVDGGSARFYAELDGQVVSLAAVRKKNRVYIYVNSCPHARAPMDFEPGQFLNLERDLILCSMHGALFRIEDGQCVHGPCLGQHLTPVASEVREGRVWLAV